MWINMVVDYIGFRVFGVVKCKVIHNVNKVIRKMVL